MNAQAALFEQLTRLVTDQLGQACVPGVAVAVLANGQAYSGGWGITSVENPLPVTDDTLFQIGSITKTFTAAAALRLVEAGKLSLDEPLRTVLPDLRFADEEVARRVTMCHLLTHSGGWDGSCFDDFGNGDDALSRIITRLPGMPQLTPLGEVFHYNNLGFYLAGRVLEVIEGKPYETVIQETLFEPLGMQTSCFFAADAITCRFVVGHEVDENNQITVGRPWAVPRAHAPAGGILSTAKDLLPYVRFCLGEASGVLQPATLARMQQPHLTIRPGIASVGLSWFIEQVDGVQVIMHGGGTLGQQSFLFLVPQHRLAAAILTNSSQGDSLIEQIYRWMLLHYCGVEVKDPDLYSRPDEQLLPYIGRYSHPMGDLEVALHEGGLMLRLHPKRDFEAPPPVHLSFFSDDCAKVPDGPFKGMEAEFLRAPDGTIPWLRLSNTIYRRESGS